MCQILAVIDNSLLFFRNTGNELPVPPRTIFQRYLLRRNTKQKNEIFTPVGCPSRCGPELMVSVGEGDKLFELLNANERIA